MSQEPTANPRNIFRLVFGNIVGSLAFLFLGVTLIGFNVLQTASLILLPFSRHAFRSFNSLAANIWWGLCVSISRRVWGVKYTYTGDHIPSGENALLLANHQEMTDINFVMAFAKDHKRLGNLKWFVKNIIKYVPGIGWGMLFLDCLYVKRSWARDKTTIEATFKRLTRDKVPFWIVSFSEGTRFRKPQLERANKFLKKINRPPHKHVQAPRPSGFVASVKGLGDHLDAVYDITIGYPNGLPTLWQYLCGFARRAHLHVKRHPAKTLPSSPKELTNWLYDRFYEKDQLLKHFFEHGRFD